MPSRNGWSSQRLLSDLACSLRRRPGGQGCAHAAARLASSRCRRAMRSARSSTLSPRRTSAGAVRIGLLSRTLPGDDRLWRAGGVGASVAAARTLVLALLIVVAASVGRVPLWPAPLLILAVACVVLVSVRISRRAAGRLGSLLQIFRSVGQSPRAGATIFGWIAFAAITRVCGAVAISLALGVSRPVWVAVVLLAAMALAGLLPLTPGNFGQGQARRQSLCTGPVSASAPHSRSESRSRRSRRFRE